MAGEAADTILDFLLVRIRGTAGEAADTILDYFVCSLILTPKCFCSSGTPVRPLILDLESIKIRMFPIFRLKMSKYKSKKNTDLDKIKVRSRQER